MGEKPRRSQTRVPYKLKWSLDDITDETARGITAYQIVKQFIDGDKDVTREDALRALLDLHESISTIELKAYLAKRGEYIDGRGGTPLQQEIIRNAKIQKKTHRS